VRLLLLLLLLPVANTPRPEDVGQQQQQSLLSGSRWRKQLKY
jgi:hypothetical protein